MLAGVTTELPRGKVRATAAISDHFCIHKLIKDFENEKELEESSVTFKKAVLRMKELLPWYGVDLCDLNSVASTIIHAEPFRM